MFDSIRAFFSGPVEMLPRVGEAALAEAVAFVARAIEAERVREAEREAARARERERRGTAEEMEFYSRRFHTRGVGSGPEVSYFNRKRTRPNLRAAVLSFSARLLTCVREKCGGDGRVAYTRSHVSKQIYSRIIAWDDTRVEKKTAMKFCLGLKLDKTESERLMKSAGFAFSDTIPLDCAVVYAIEHGIWNIDDVNEILIRSSQPPLD